jgi:hypothetical protein
MAGMNNSDSHENDKKRGATRRRFLQLGGALGSAFALSPLFPSSGHSKSKHHKHRTPPQDASAAKTLRKFEDPLPIPAVISPTAIHNGVPLYDVTMTVLRTVVHLHGSKSMPESDGYPEAWFTRRNHRSNTRGQHGRTSY